MRGNTFLSYLLINDICLFKLFYFNSIDIKVPREPIIAQLHLSVNAGNLDKHWYYPNFCYASCHYRKIVPHLHAYFCHKVSKELSNATKCIKSTMGVFKLIIVAKDRIRFQIYRCRATRTFFQEVFLVSG